MSILKAAQHYGLARKSYKFEMRIHKLILPTSGSTLEARILWSRRKKRAANYKTSWIRGREEFIVDQVICHYGTIFLTSTTNQIQSKYTTIAIEIINPNPTGVYTSYSNSRDYRKHSKYCSIKIDLSDYINISMPEKIFTKHLKYKNSTGNKKAELIFSIKSTEISPSEEDERGKLFDGDSAILSEDGSHNASNISLISKTSIESSQFNELRKKHVAIQRKMIQTNQRGNDGNDIKTDTNERRDAADDDDEDNYTIPIIVRRTNHNNHLQSDLHMAESITTTTNTTTTHSEREVRDNDSNLDQSPYSLYTKYIQRKHEENDTEEVSDNPPPFVMNDSSNPRMKKMKAKKFSIAGSAISICTTSSSDDDEHDNRAHITPTNDMEHKSDDEEQDRSRSARTPFEEEREEEEASDDANDSGSDENDINYLRSKLEFYKLKMIEFDGMKSKLRKMRKTVRCLEKDNTRLQQKVASLQTVIEHKNNEQRNSFSVFEYWSFEDCLRLNVGDYIDHRDETGHFLLAKITKINQSQNTNFVHIHYEGWAKKWDVWIDMKKETLLRRIAPPRSISRKSNTRFLELEIEDNIDLNPMQRHPGWRGARIKKMDKYSGQVQCQYVEGNEKYFYWAHLNDRNEIAPFMTRSCD